MVRFIAKDLCMSTRTILLILSFLLCRQFLSAQKHSVELGYKPYTYYHDYYDLGWNRDQSPIPNVVLRYSYKVNDRWNASIGTLLIRGPFRGIIFEAANEKRYLSSMVRIYSLDMQYSVGTIGRLELLPHVGLTYTNRSTGLGTWVGAPFFSAGNTFDSNKSIGYRVGSSLRLNLPYNFFINYDVGFYHNMDNEASRLVIMFATAGIKF